MKTPHIHAELIKAWADGADIQQNIYEDTWFDIANPEWHKNTKYRVKPEPKPDLIRYARASCLHYADDDLYSINNNKVMTRTYWTQANNKDSNIKATFDGETFALKSVEMIIRTQ